MKLGKAYEINWINEYGNQINRVVTFKTIGNINTVTVPLV